MFCTSMFLLAVSLLYGLKDNQISGGFLNPSTLVNTHYLSCYFSKCEPMFGKEHSDGKLILAPNSYEIL